MPSPLVAWALWCALAVWVVRKDRTTRGVPVAYSAGTIIVRWPPPNHYFLDVVAGALPAASAAGFAMWHRPWDSQMSEASP